MDERIQVCMMDLCTLFLLSYERTSDSKIREAFRRICHHRQRGFEKNQGEIDDVRSKICCACGESSNLSLFCCLNCTQSMPRKENVSFLTILTTSR